MQRRGPQSLSVVGAAAWNLAELAELRAAGGLDAVAARLAAEPVASGGDGGDGGDGSGDSDGRDRAAGEERVPERRIRMSTGYEMNPWADLQPPGTGPATGRKLWHSSPGSAG